MESSGSVINGYSSLLTYIRARPKLQERLKRGLDAIGYDTTDWVRVAMYQHSFEFIRSLGPESLNVLEISGGNQWSRHFNFASYTATQYPAFDICRDKTDRQFDLIIADQIFEHLEWPMRAARNVFAMLQPGGHFIIATPFLVRLHEVPIDCSRWTERGLSCLLQEAGFQEENIKTFAWGNRACVKANFKSWRKRGFGSMKNEANFPVMVWAIARRGRESEMPSVSAVRQQDLK
jgi:SAM-dependent methyltransferase